MATIQGMMSAGNVETFVVKTVFDSKGFEKGVAKTQTHVRKLKNGFEEVSTATFAANGRMTKLNETIRKQREQFSMWALSFMFAGMQIQRVSQQIATVSVSTFMKITQGQTDAGKAVTGLAANFKFLQFQVGQAMAVALRPLLPVLISIIRNVASFVNANPGLAFASIAAAFTLGGGLFLGSQVMLFAESMVTLANAGGLKVVLGSVAGAFSTIGAAVVAMLPALAVIAAIAALGAVSWKAFNETPEAWNAVKDSMTALTGPNGSWSRFVDSMQAMVQTIMPDFTLNWENVAWTIGWALRSGISIISAMLDGITALISGVQALTNSFSALFAVMAGDFSSAAKYDRLHDAARDRLKTSFSSMGSNLRDYGSTLASGPMGLKNQYQEQQRLEQSRSAFGQSSANPINIYANVLNMGGSGTGSASGTSAGIYGPIRRTT